MNLRKRKRDLEKDEDSPRNKKRKLTHDRPTSEQSNSSPTRKEKPKAPKMLKKKRGRPKKPKRLNFKSVGIESGVYARVNGDSSIKKGLQSMGLSDTMNNRIEFLMTQFQNIKLGLAEKQSEPEISVSQFNHKVYTDMLKKIDRLEKTIQLKEVELSQRTQSRIKFIQSKQRLARLSKEWVNEKRAFVLKVEKLKNPLRLLNVEELKDDMVMHFFGIKTKREFLEEFNIFKNDIKVTRLTAWHEATMKRYENLPTDWLNDDDVIEGIKSMKNEAVDMGDLKKKREGRKRELTDLQMFSLFCARLRRGWRVKTLAHFFSINVKQVCVYTHFIAFVIHQHLKRTNYFRFRSKEELDKITPIRTKRWRKKWKAKEFDPWIAKINNKFPELVDSLEELYEGMDVHAYDCSYLYLFRNWDWKFQRETYCSNKKRNCIKLATVTGCNGFTETFYLSYGSFSDTRCFEEAGWKKELEKNIRKNKFQVPIGIVMDKGMESLHFNCPLIKRFAPQKFHGDNEEMKKEVCDDAFKISSSRIAIEQSYSRVKAFRLLSHTLSLRDVVHLEDYVAVALYFVNKYRDPLTK